MPGGLVSYASIERGFVKSAVEQGLCALSTHMPVRCNCRPKSRLRRETHLDETITTTTFHPHYHHHAGDSETQSRTLSVYPNMLAARPAEAP